MCQTIRDGAGKMLRKTRMEQWLEGCKITMMALTFRGVGRRLGQLVWLVPLLAAVQQVGGGGVPPAEACSGGGPGPGEWLHLDVAAAPLGRVPVATDGFVAFAGLFYFGETDAAVEVPWVRVVDDAGETVPGQVRILKSDTDTSSTKVLLGWQSAQALPVGAVFQLTLAPANGAAGEGGAGNLPSQSKTVELEVVEEPVTLPTPTVTLGPWVDVRHGVGELVDCEEDTSCGRFTLRVPTSEMRLPGVSVSWEPPDFSSMVAWEVRAQTANARDEVTSSLNREALVARKREEGEVIELGQVVFADDASEYCVVLIVKDLRTGKETSSQPVCESPREPEYERADHDLASCDEPPTPESLPLWCAGRPSDELCPDQVGQAGEGGGGQAGSAQAGQPADVAEPAIATRESPSGGCQLTPGAGSASLATAALGALLSLVTRRRRKR